METEVELSNFPVDSICSSQTESLNIIEPISNSEINPVMTKKQLKKKLKKDIIDAKKAYKKAKKASKDAERDLNYVNRIKNPNGTETLEVESCGVFIFRKRFESNSTLNGTNGNETERKVIYEFLLLTKPNGKFDFPKGHRHQDESPLDGAYRETAEETGISRDMIRHMNWEPHVETYYPFYKRFNAIVTKRLVMYFGLLSDNDVPVILTEHSKYEWRGYIPREKIQENTVDSVLTSFEKYLVIGMD